MTEWTVVTVIVVLVGLFFTVGKPIMSVAKEMNMLRFETDRQEKEIDRNIESLRELSKIAQAHETRIQNTESAVDKLAATVSELTRSRRPD